MGGRRGRGKETRRKWKIKDEKMANDEDKDKEGTRKTRRQERGKGEESRRREIFKEKPVNGRRKRREKRTKQNDSINQENSGKSLDKVSKNNQKGMQKKEHQRFIKQPSQKKERKKCTRKKESRQRVYLSRRRKTAGGGYLTRTINYTHHGRPAEISYRAGMTSER